MEKIWKVVVALVIASVLVGCGGGGNDGPGSSSASINVPTTISLMPANQNGAQRLFVSVIAVGSQQTSLPLLFDTGSGGVTMDATKLFPASIVDSNGFVFAGGATSITYSDITVTNARADVVFPTTIQHGNIGSATIRFGNPDGFISTASMPILFYYAITDRAGNPLPMPASKGIFGVGATTSEANGSLASPMRYISFANLNVGFSLGPVGNYPLCDITQGTCTPKPLLTLGIDSAQEANFSMFPMICDPQTINGPQGALTVNPGTGGCASLVPGTVSVDGVVLNASPLAALLFDTGTPAYSLSTIVAQSAPPRNALVQVSLPATIGVAPLSFSWRVSSGVDADTSVSSGPVIVGSNFFLMHAYLVDFSARMVGVR